MKKLLITGCAGFIGKNLLKNLISDHKIIGVDNFYSSRPDSIKEYLNSENFKFIKADITNLPNIDDDIDVIYNLACPASPPIYQKDPLFTLNTNYKGTKNLLELAKLKSSIFIQASTSEVYGDPKENPQTEEYNGNVNTIGIRSCYDEGKRIAETLCFEYRKLFNVKTRILRIFNTYGPGMDINDGRVVSNFLVNIIKDKSLVIYGDGKQTRSFCYIDDLIKGLITASKVDFKSPINLGNDKEVSLNQFIEILRQKYKNIRTEYIESVADDPRVRRPNIDKAKKILNWEPVIDIGEGIDKTYNYFESIINNEQ